MRNSLSFLVFLFSCFTGVAQTGGGAVYSFLDVPASARIAALGGTLISVRDDDINAALQAPSLINPGMNGALALNAVTYVDGVKFGDAAYARDYKSFGTFMGHIHYANYGQFLETNDFGDITGTFHASDYALDLGWGYNLNSLFSVGATLRGIYSDYYIYNAFGIAADVSATLCDTTSHWTATLLFRNFGSQLKNYVRNNNEPLPAEALIAVSKRLTHTPLRFNITYRHLEKFDITYTDPLNTGDVDPVTGEATIKETKFSGKLARHFIIGTEILLSKNFHLRAAYNFERRQELQVSTRPGTVGFSFGVGLKISKFILGYGFGNYHLAGGASHFSISTRLSEFTKKRTPVEG
ncbi:MAG: type IX secretion system protein PorQ [Bacteroidia bacterium]|nr:type IX secretion system protein PorQ [Bacteroidia bacterium]